MVKGEITVFLSIVFILLISFVFGLTEAATLQASKNRKRLEAENGIYSVFGEYQVELLKKYNIFAFDAGYGTARYEDENIVKRIHYYGAADSDITVEGLQFLTDNSGSSFREQVMEYMEGKYGISLARKYTGMTEEWKEEEIRENRMEEEKNNSVREIEALMGNAADGEALSEGEAGDTFFILEKIERELLSYILPSDMTLSENRTNLEEQVSNRTLNPGKGEFLSRTGLYGAEGRILFNEYVLNKFRCGTSDTEEGNQNLSYEIEYILIGKESDRENLESVLHRIYIIRMALNYLHLSQDSIKKGEAEAFAVTLTALLLIPEAAEAVTQILLIIWSAAESVVDVRALVGGRKVAAVKDEQTWQVPFSSLFTFITGGNRMEGEDVENGISYEHYLRMFLFLTPQEEVTMRTLDRVEENIRSKEGCAYFRADCCVTKLDLTDTARIYGNITYQFPLAYGYR